MSAEAEIPMDDPRRAAWEDYKATADYANTRRWALHEAHVDGSLWAAFISGWHAAEGHAVGPKLRQAAEEDVTGEA